MIAVHILEDHDVILPDDWVRPLSLIYDGQSDEVYSASEYSGSPMNRLGWISAKIYCPAWVGETVGEFCQAALRLGRHSTETCNYEFIRGPIPARHLEVLSKEQQRIADMVWSFIEDHS